MTLLPADRQHRPHPPHPPRLPHPPLAVPPPANPSQGAPPVAPPPALPRAAPAQATPLQAVPAPPAPSQAAPAPTATTFRTELPLLVSAAPSRVLSRTGTTGRLPHLPAHPIYPPACPLHHTPTDRPTTLIIPRRPTLTKDQASPLYPVPPPCPQRASYHCPPSAALSRQNAPAQSLTPPCAPSRQNPFPPRSREKVACISTGLCRSAHSSHPTSPP